MKKIHTVLFSILLTLTSFASKVPNGSPPAVSNLIPRPVEVEILSDKLYPAHILSATIDPQIDLPREGYTLESTKKGVRITARSSQGAIWAKQTLDQLAEDGRVPHLRIRDYPAFEIRGFLHDVGRNFIEVDTLKRHIDILSSYKINTFQWHLTDYPAWRIESKAYPQLNDPRNHRAGRNPGRFYTYDQIRDVIAYAKERGIMVMPEIDIPGHSTYFNTTFGFGMASPEGKRVLEDCLNEFFAEIPRSDCPYLHIGSDEVHIDNPVGFMQWADSLVRTNNRIPVAWDPGLPATSNTVRQIWSDAAAVTSQLNLKGAFLDSFMGYLNYYDPTIFVARMFMHNPAGRAVGDSLALGGILCLWNDIRVDDKHKIISHSGAWSGLLPYAERFWSGGVTPDGVTNPNLYPDPASKAGVALAEFEQRMDQHRKRDIFKGEPFSWVPNAAIKWQVSEPLVADAEQQKLRSHEPLCSEPHKQAIASAKWHTLWGGGVDLDAFCSLLDIKQDAIYDLYAQTTIEAANDTIITAMIGFESPARSNRLSVGIGEQGKWEGGARIWLNGADIAPAQQWQEPGAHRYEYHTWHKAPEEVPFTDEQLYWCRKPVQLSLKKGTNTITIYAPKTFPLQRWNFAFLPL